MDYFNYHNVYQPQKGRLLVSEPFLPDKNFERSVVLLCEHNEEGSFGFILNHLSNVNLSDVMNETAASLKNEIYIGGPVEQNTIHFLHTNPDISDAIEIRNGIYWGGNFEQVLHTLKLGLADEYDYKFFIGYSGWGKEQLTDELESGSWIVVDQINKDLIFNSKSKKMWKDALKTLGGRFNVYSNYPEDPRLN